MTHPFVPVDAHLARLAASQPDTPALHIPLGRGRHHSPTFAELNALVDRFTTSLQALGLVRGERLALMVPPCEEFFALTFAALRGGFVPVLIDPGMGRKNLGRCLAEADVAAFLGVPKAILARILFGWCPSARISVTVGRRRWFGTTTTDRFRFVPPLPKPETFGPEDPAAILFTSGSTGLAKGVPYSHGTFAAQVEMLKAMYGIESGEVDWCSFPLFALFGPALGMTCVIPEMNASKPATVNPETARKQIRDFGVTNLFGSPAVIRRLALDHDPESYRTVRRVLSAGAPARTDVLEAMQKQLPAGVQVFTPYGATESLPVANIGSAEILGETAALTAVGRGVCIGRPAPGVTVRIIRIDDDMIETWADELLVKPGEIGEFVVESAVTTTEYFRRPGAAAFAKIRGPLGVVHHRMGDVGYVDDAGRLWFCGRKSQRVVTPMRTYFTDCVEPIFNAIQGVERTALVGVSVRSRLGGLPPAARRGIFDPVLCVELKRDAVWRIIEPKLQEVGTPLGLRRFLKHPRFPVDVRHNSKIFREKLAVWAAGRLGIPESAPHRV